MSRSAKHGIIIKNGGALERLAEARSIAFDKTGTLTQGLLEVAKVRTFEGQEADAVIAAAASLEQHSNHVVARAIMEEARERQQKLAKVKNLRETAGQGLSGLYGGKDVKVGRLRYLESEGITMPKKLPAIDETATYVAIGGHLAGVITFSDTVRPESKETVSLLRKLKFDRILMVTGDNKANALATAKTVGIAAEDVTAEALPADKLHAIDAVKERPIAFVGDGVNDAPVLTAADVGIALGARGSTAASQSADIVIMLDDVGRVATAAHIADRTFRIARQSILIGIGISLVLMLIFATGRFTPLSGALLQEVVDVIVILNALRAHSEIRKLR
jgi:P-type E1-E2 ATPase